MAERVGFEPTSPFGRTAFRERRLKPTRQPLQNSANESMRGSHPTRLARTIWVRTRAWNVLSRSAPSAFLRAPNPRLLSGEPLFESGALSQLGNLSF